MKKLVISSAWVLLLLTSCGSEHESELEQGSGIMEWVGVLFKEHSPQGPTFLGQSFAKDIGIENLTGGQRKQRTFHKIAESMVFRTDLVNLRYDLQFDYDVQVGGRGHHIANITYVPNLDVESTVSLDAKTLTTIRNIGTTTTPISEAKVAITYTLNHLLGSISRTDEFVINGQTGKVRSLIREFEAPNDQTPLEILW